MSRLGDLINRLCPNGVKYKKLGDVVSVNRGSRLTKSQLSDDGIYEVYHGSKDVPLGKYNSYNTSGDTVIVVNTGGIGGVKYLENDFWCSDGSFNLGHNELLNNKFLYHFLLQYEKFFLSKKRVGGVPTIDRKIVEDVKIPIPPLEIQDEIVRILDKFEELEAELEAELKARREQYDFWRGKLFDISDAKVYKFDDISKIITKQTGFDYTNHIKSSLVVEKTDESIPYIQTKFFTGKNFNYNTDYYIPKKDAYKFNKILLNNKCILLSIVGASIGNVGLFDGKTESFLGGAIGLVKLKDDINIDYVYHYLQSPYGQAQIKNNIKGSGQASLTIDSIRNFMIPIPSNDKQNKIVSILDKMETLVNDITAGLPAEIELRRKQYEYYRNKLLSFEELSVSE